MKRSDQAARLSRMIDDLKPALDWRWKDLLGAWASKGYPTGGHTLDWHKGYVAALHGLIHHATGMTYRTIALRLNQRILEATE